MSDLSNHPGHDVECPSIFSEILRQLREIEKLPHSDPAIIVAVELRINAIRDLLSMVGRP